MSAHVVEISTPDQDRRAKLKVFLESCRSRLKPDDVGLPSTGRRRVSGLRREEVAELIGVSSDWYRWFESGRSIRVSVPFLKNLCEALQLEPFERINLFYLALPEIYEAYLAQRNTVISLMTNNETHYRDGVSEKRTAQICERLRAYAQRSPA